MRRSVTLFYLAAFCTLAQIATALFVEVPVSWPAAALALFCGLVSAIFVVWPLIALSRNGRLLSSAGTAPVLEPLTHGPYAIVRHPLYLGYMLLNATFILSNPYWPAMLLGTAAAAAFYFAALGEEARLHTASGAAYDSYREKVPAFNAPLGLLRVLNRADGGRR